MISCTSCRAVHLKDYVAFPFEIEEVNLSFDLNEAQTIVHSEIRMKKIPSSAAAPLELNGQGCELQAIYMDDRQLKEGRDYAISPAHTEGVGHILKIPSPPLDRTFTLGVVTKVHPDGETACEGIYMSNGCILTQCEAEGFRRITYFPDRPDALGKKWTTKLIADFERFPVLLGNGNLAAQGTLPGGRHYTVWVDPWPKPCYLFCLVAGKLVATEGAHSRPDGRGVALKIWTEEHNKHKTDWALASLKRAFEWDESRWGRVYDLDLFNVVVVDDFNMGAMENKSLNIFNSRLVLATPETATDANYESIEGVIGHEYFHNWSGNRVTLNNWFQLSLKEGLTVFRDQEFTSDMNSRSAKRIDDVRLMREDQFGEDAGSMAHPIRPPSYEKMDNFYTSTVYEKGAEVIRMYETLLGKPGFRKGLDLYFDRHDGQAVSCDDFYRAMMDANPDFEPGDFFLWYNQAGTPVVTVKHSYDASAGTLTLTMSQSLPKTSSDPPGVDKKPMVIPVAVGLVGPDGKDMEISQFTTDGIPSTGLAAGTTTAVLVLRKHESTFVISNVSSAPVPSILRNFSAPVKLKSDLTEQQILFLLAHDSDAVTRWDSAQTLARSLVLSLAKDPTSVSADIPPSIVSAFRAVLTDKAIDKRLAAHMLSFPSVAELCEHVELADPLALHNARMSVIRGLAATLAPEFREVFESNAAAPGVAYAPDVEQTGRRALRLAALGFVSVTDGGVQVAVEAFQSATNMTDQLAALRLLCDWPGPQRDEALAAFYKQWAGEMLCVTKWLTMQSCCELPGNTGAVEKLLSHPAFDLRSPNKCYALVGSFSRSVVNFHAADGSGYKLLADMALKVDAVNPQVAVRCMGEFTSFQAWDASRQAMVVAELKRMDKAGLSSNCSEIVQRSLKQVENK